MVSRCQQAATVEFARKARVTVDGRPVRAGMCPTVVRRDSEGKVRPVTGEEQVHIESLRDIEGWTQW